jgi:hypothetical protein
MGNFIKVTEQASRYNNLENMSILLRRRPHAMATTT